MIDNALDHIDYCSHACLDANPDAFPITPWADEVCGCCGAVWGEDNDSAVCRGKHVEGEVWWLLADAEQGDLAATEALRSDPSQTSTPTDALPADRAASPSAPAKASDAP